MASQSNYDFYNEKLNSSDINNLQNQYSDSLANRYLFQSFSNNANSLDLMLYGLNHSRRWVYHFCHDFRIKCNYNNLLQVKFQSDSPLIDWVTKVLNAGQCAAILLENRDIDSDLLEQVKHLCEGAGTMLIVLEPRVCTVN